MNRKYFHSLIKDLESLFENGQHDQALLRDLQEELTHRKTDRAAKLRLRVNALLTGTQARSTQKSMQQSIDFPTISPNVTTPVLPKPVLSESEERASPRADTATSATLRASIRNNPQPSPPSVDNSAESILSAWIALEVLSPPAFRRPEDLVSGDRSRITALGINLPWERGERSRPNYRLYYQIILGAIQLEPPLQLLMERYADSRIEKPSIRGKAALAVIIVDREGHLISPPAVGISSFGWGVISALKGKLADLADWPNIESQLVARIERQFGNDIADKTGATDRPVTRMAVLNAYEDIVRTLELPSDWLEPPEFAIRSFTYFKDRNPPESILLNSFFLSDLAIARELFRSRKAPNNLRRYLGIERPMKSEDLVQNRSALEQAVSPDLTPLARWPAPRRSSLVLLQQAAVNLGFKETRDRGLLGINGPPGTGKTTLLRDFVAAVVTERALGMSKFDDPETAFEPTGLKLKVGSGWIHLYKLNTSLKGFEMVVASSNNKAVENVSGELPGLNAIANDAADLRYFKTLSDSLHPTDTWGMIAAVLGNMQNRSRFKQSFWWDEEKGFNAYLRAAIDSSATEDDSEPKQIVREEQPPKSRDEALTRWRVARDRFTQAVNKSHKWQSWLSSIREDVASLHSLAESEATAQQEYRRAANVVRELKPTKARRTQDRESAEQQSRVHAFSRPGFWMRLFRTKAARKWNEFNAALLELHKTEMTLTAARAAHETTKRRTSEAHEKHGVVLVDSKFFELRHDLRHRKNALVLSGSSASAR